MDRSPSQKPGADGSGRHLPTNGRSGGSSASQLQRLGPKSWLVRTFEALPNREGSSMLDR